MVGPTGFGGKLGRGCPVASWISQETTLRRVCKTSTGGMDDDPTLVWRRVPAHLQGRPWHMEAFRYLGGVSLSRRGLCLAGLYPGRSLSRGLCLWRLSRGGGGGSIQGSICPRGFLSKGVGGVSVHGDSTQGISVQRAVSIQGSLSGRHTRQRSQYSKEREVHILLDFNTKL